MDEDEEVLLAAVLAVLDARHHQAKFREALARRDQAWLKLYGKPGWTYPKVERRMRDMLTARGVTEDELLGLGVTQYNARRVVSGSRPPLVE